MTEPALSDAATAVALPTLTWGDPSSHHRVLALHGLCASANTWWRVADTLARHGVFVVAPDLRGHGSAPRATTYRIEDHAADVVALGAGWDVVIAHSLAGPVAIHASRSVGFAARLLLLDPVLEIDAQAFEAVVADQLSELDPNADPDAILAANPSWHAEDAFHKAVGARTTSPFVVEQCLRDNAPWDHVGLLAVDGRPPIHVLAADPAIGSMCTLPNPLPPGVTCTVIPHVGHGIHRAAPEQVIDAALSMLGRPTP